MIKSVGKRDNKASNGDRQPDPMESANRSKSSISEPSSTEPLTRSLERLGYAPGQLQVSIRNSSRHAFGTAKQKRQFSVAVNGSRVTIADRNLDRDEDGADVAPEAPERDPVLVLHQSLIRAGVNPPTLSPADEESCNAA